MSTNVLRLPVKRAPKSRRVKLTNENIARLKLQPGDRVYDDSLGGFYIQAGKRGGATYRVMADPPKRARALGLPKTLNRTVGKWPGMSAAKARVEAGRLIAMIKGGNDPTQPEINIEGPTLDEGLVLYVAGLQKKVEVDKIQPATITFYEKSVARIDKKLRARPLAVLGANKQLLKDEHARLSIKSGKVAADHSIVAVRAIYNHALKTWSDLPANPVKAVDRNGIPDRAEHGMGLEDLAGWWAEVQKIRNEVKRQLMLFMLLTGLRSTDARTAKLAELDEAGKNLWIPCPKGGKRKAFSLPVSDAAMACIYAARATWESKEPRSEYLFPSTHGKTGYFSNPRVERVIDGERDRSLATGHKLRHTFATCAEAAGYAEGTYGVLLNHTPKSVTGKYPNRKKNMDTLYRTVANDIANLMMKAIAS